MLLRFLTLFLVCCSVNANEYGNVTVEEVTSIYDADSFRVNIPSWPDIIGYRVPVRVSGIDAPELKGKCKEEKTAARLAKKRTVNLLRSAKVIELRNIQRGKYFRILADVYVDGNSLAEDLISNGLAVSYSGGKRINWCS